MTKVLLTESYLDDIADAIREKRGVLTEYKPSQMAGAIMDIDTHDTHDATASAGDVLTGKTAYIATGKVSGTMPNQGAIAGTIDAEHPSYTVPEGYHSGLGTVSADVATTLEVEAYVGRIRKLAPKTITENGTYKAEDDNVGGYSQVTVNVAGAEVETVSFYGWTYGGYSAYAMLKRIDGAVFGKVAISGNNEVLTGSLISFSYYGNGTGDITVTALEAITLTVYSATTSSSTGSALTGTEYQMAANETKTITNPNYGGGLFITAEAAS